MWRLIFDGIELLEHRTILEQDSFVYVDGHIFKERKGYFGSFFTCQPAPGYSFVYEVETDRFTPTRHLDKPVNYTLKFQANTEAAVKEIESLLTAMMRHTTTFKDFEVTK